MLKEFLKLHYNEKFNIFIGINIVVNLLKNRKRNTLDLQQNMSEPRSSKKLFVFFKDVNLLLSLLLLFTNFSYNFYKEDCLVQLNLQRLQINDSMKRYFIINIKYEK